MIQVFRITLWCSIAPRINHRDLGGPQDYPNAPNAVWSLTCFSIAKPHRKTGLSGHLLEAAIDYARENGAIMVEAYPIAPDSPSYQYMGLVPQFERRGFVYVQDAGKRRRVHRLQL
ncbi:MAG: hypothetical protein CSA68_05870 [Rhodobacterales bacterium]|nr:MAG: hypothetical protein CSA68_05870 [Rhodobacterales bacterium]